MGYEDGENEGLRLGASVGVEVINISVGDPEGMDEGVGVVHPPHDTGHSKSISYSEHPSGLEATLLQNPG